MDDERRAEATPPDPYAGIFRPGQAADEAAERTEIEAERADREAEAANIDDEGAAMHGQHEPDAPHGLTRSAREDAAIASADPDREAILSDDLVADEADPAGTDPVLEREAAEADALEAARGTHA